MISKIVTIFKAAGDYYDTIVNTEKLLKTEIGNDMVKFEELTDFICSSTYDEVYLLNLFSF